MTILFNRTGVKFKRQALRNNSTIAEEYLWQRLRKSQLKGKKFRRQYSVGYYILDFYCSSEKIAVELDGAQHFEEGKIEYDENRTKYLETVGIKVLRFGNIEVINNIEAVLQAICNCIK